MTTPLPDVFFIAGTDTDVGKTFVSAVLMMGLPAASYWKPVQSGQEPCTDRQWLQATTELPPERCFPETYCFSQPLSPHAAAAIDGVTIETARLRQDFSDHRKKSQDTNFGPGRPRVIVEGAGGLMVPLTDDVLVIDLITQLHLPVLLVCRSTLGTINHTLLSIEQLRARHIPLLGIVMNGPKNESNRQAIENFGKARVIAQLDRLQTVNAAALKSLYDTEFHNAIDVNDGSDHLASVHTNANGPDATKGGAGARS